MISLLTTIFKTLLPDRARLLISLSTIFVCIATVSALRHFKISGSLPTSLFPVMLDSLAVALFVVLGMIVLFITSSQKHKSPRTREPKSRKDLSANALLILTIFGKQGVEPLTTEHFSKAMELSFNQAQLAIEELLNFNFLHTDTPWGEDPIYWLSPKGRAFLGKEQLL